MNPGGCISPPERYCELLVEKTSRFNRGDPQTLAQKTAKAGDRVSSHVTHTTLGLYDEGDESYANGLAGSTVRRKLSLLGNQEGVALIFCRTPNS